MRIINRKNHIATNQKKRDEFNLVNQPGKELTVLTLWFLFIIFFLLIIGSLALIYLI